MLLDRSGQGKVYQLISRRRFQQMEVLEGQNILVTISGKKNRVRVYYLSWLKSKILRTDGASDVSIPHLLTYGNAMSVVTGCAVTSLEFVKGTRPEGVQTFYLLFLLHSLENWDGYSLKKIFICRK